jgi:hypothetical protein
MAAGTVAAMAASVDWVGMVAVGSGELVDGADAAVVVGELLELLQAAARSATPHRLPTASTLTLR